MPLKVVIIYRDDDFRGLQPGLYRWNWDLRPERLLPWLWHDIIDEISSPWVQFKIFHEMYETRNFRLELCADVWSGVADAVEKTRRDFDGEFPELVLTSCRPRIFHSKKN